MTSTLLTCTASSRPGSPKDGDTLFETDTNRIIVWDDNDSVWRVYNSDSIAVNTLGTNELHYPTGLWSSASATHYISVSPEIHFDANIIDGADSANNPSDGTGISSWGNRSGSSTSYTATQSTAGNQPAFTASGPGSKPTATFDGSDVIYLATDYDNTGASFTLITVSQGSATGSSVATQGPASRGTHSSGLAIWAKQSGDDWTVASNRGDITAPENFTMHTVVRTGTACELFEDGGTSLSTWTNASRMIFGSMGKAYLYHPGTVSEVFLFDSALSTANLNKIKTYVASKYGLTSSGGTGGSGLVAFT